MPLIDPAYWSEYLRQTLQCYEVSLLRNVAAPLLKPRNQWPVAELIDRCVAVTTNTALIDRRLSELDAPERQLLALIGHSRQPRWNLGNLVELLMALGHAEGLPTVLKLFEQGLLYPDLPAVKVPRLKSFEQWVGQTPRPAHRSSHILLWRFGRLARSLACRSARRQHRPTRVHPPK